MTKTWILAALLLGGCFRPENHYHYQLIDDEQVNEEKTTSSGMPDLLESVDQRKSGHKVETPAVSPFAPKLHLRPRNSARPAPNALPVGADREPPPAPTKPEPQPTRLQAVEVDRGNARAYVLKPGDRPPPRWEVRSLVERCERRPTQWARERCMENGE